MCKSGEVWGGRAGRPQAYFSISRFVQPFVFYLVYMYSLYLFSVYIVIYLCGFLRSQYVGVWNVILTTISLKKLIVMILVAFVYACPRPKAYPHTCQVGDV